MERLFWTNVSPRLLDFLRVAMSVYVADRLGRRKQQSQDRRWFRSLKLSVAVQEPEFWESDEVFATLMECLDFLSEDAWDLKFVKDRREQPPDVARFLSGDNPFAAVPPMVCLYSGGLDSAAGLGIRIAETEIALDSGNGLAPTKPKKNRSAATRFLERAIWRLNSPPDRQGGNGLVLRLEGIETRKEPAMPVLLLRGRGAVAAAISEVTKIEVFESGIGAINLPLLAGMVGSRATRGSHPHFFRLMSRLASLAAGREVAFHLPFH